MIRTPSVPRALLPLPAAAGLLLVTACGGPAGEESGARDVTVAMAPADRATGVAPGSPVTLRVTGGQGTLADVSVTDQRGQRLDGSLSADGRSWTSVPATRPSSTYTLAYTAKSADGSRRNGSGTVTTAAPEKPNKLELRPGNGATVGVAQPVSVLFDHRVGDAEKVDIERNLRVETSPRTEGSWGWVKDFGGHDRIDWRPRDFWKPGTKVSLKGELAGLPSGQGRYFARNYATSFTIGENRVVTVDVAGHRMAVTEGGKAVASYPISAGSDTYPTRGGTHVVLAKNAKETMKSATVGLGDAYPSLPTTSVIHLTSSGTFIHAADWNADQIGSANTSHGCVGMLSSDARKLFDRVRLGDPVIVKNTRNTEITEPGNGIGAWQMDWPAWKKRSALKG
ncbi:Ig-like domain-containing protein [Streptomyces sp. NPDC018019]|uniref:Ig-like domain-containing protein n=1 Tax=Streptomyces sp. NPDC018019 TaxID=3365030 RepID=UPI0037BB6801